MENQSGRFTKNDVRCWRGGRPKTFNAVRKLVQSLCDEEVTYNGEKMQLIEKIMRQWARSRVPALQLAFISYGFGKPPDRIEVDSNRLTNIVVKFAADLHEQTSQLQDDNHTAETPLLADQSPGIDR